MVCALSVIPSSVENMQAPSHKQTCSLCIFQRNSSLYNIAYRTITGEYNGPEEQTFGHCFFCLSCDGIDDIPCYGWWPADPDGGDFEGDNGSLHPDAKEDWDFAQCISISETQADQLMVDMDIYEQHHRYQVLNSNGTSCLGFCSDVLNQTNATYTLPFGDLSLSGSLFIQEPFVRVRNTDHTLPAVFMRTLQRTIPNHSSGMMWNQSYYDQQRGAIP